MLWLQAWLLECEATLAETAQTATVTVQIPELQTLKSGLDNEWQQIARGRDPIAMVLALRELAAVAAGDFSYAALFGGVLTLLEKINAPNRMWAAEKVIDAL